MQRDGESYSVPDQPAADASRVVVPSWLELPPLSEVPHLSRPDHKSCRSNNSTGTTLSGFVSGWFGSPALWSMPSFTEPAVKTNRVLTSTHGKKTACTWSS